MAGPDIFFLLSRLILVAVFGLAGVAKLLDRETFRRTLSDFGVPGPLTAPASLILPAGELVVALGLLFLATSTYAAAGAFVLLLLFIAGIAGNLVRGRRPKCQCFGQVHTEPIGKSILVRNVVLSALALLVLFGGPGGSTVEWIGPMTSFERAIVAGGEVALALLAIQTVLLIALVRRRSPVRQALAEPAAVATLATLAGPAAAVPAPLVVEAVPGALDASGQTPPPAYNLQREPGIPVGYAAPEFTAATMSGQTLTLASLRAIGRPILAVFSDPNCEPCGYLLPEVAQWSRERGDALTFLVLSRGTVEENESKAGDLDRDRVLLQRDREIGELYGIMGTPSALVIRPDGSIGSPLAQADAAIRELVNRWAPPPESNVPKPLDVAPSFTLPNLKGEMVALAQFKGKPTLLVFWNPTCTFCERIVRDLKLWEEKPLADRAQMVLIATGSEDDNRMQGLASEILMDPMFSVGPLYGANSTPSAILIDADGRLTGPLVTGTSDVLALAGQPETPWDGSAPIRERTLSGSYVPLTTFPVDAKPLRQDCVMDEMLSDGSILLYNGCRRHLLTLNATAALVWDMCDGSYELAHIVNEVREVFPEAANPENDVKEMLDLLLNGDMIAPAEVTPAAVAATSVGA